MRLPVKKLTIMAALTAAALIIFIIEAQIPLPIPIPGAKLGLANVITLFALFYKQNRADDAFYFATADVFAILVCRIVLGSFFSGRFIAFIYSISGGLISFLALVILKRFISDKQIWACGVVGAILHNTGQIAAAMLITGTPAIAALLPGLIIVGVITGIITGSVAQLTLMRIARQR